MNLKNAWARAGQWLQAKLGVQAKPAEEKFGRFGMLQMSTFDISNADKVVILGCLSEHGMEALVIKDKPNGKYFLVPYMGMTEFQQAIKAGDEVRAGRISVRKLGEFLNPPANGSLGVPAFQNG